MQAQCLAPCIVVSIGECMIELSSAGEGLFKQSFAGDTLNTAVYLSRSLKGTGHKVCYATAVGHDSLSDDMLPSWPAEQIDCSLVARVQDKQPGLYAIAVDSYGERTFTYWRNDSAAKQMFTAKGFTQDQREAITQRADIIYLSGITLAILDDESRSIMLSLLQKARASGAKVVFDSNYRPRLWSSPEVAQATFNRILELTDIALVTFDDEQLLFGDSTPQETLKRLSAIEEVVVKNGAKGCLLRWTGGQELVASTKVERVVDTTSAGDSFNGAYLAGRAQGRDPVSSARAGHRMAGTVIQYPGAIIPEQATNKLTGQ